MKKFSDLCSDLDCLPPVAIVAVGGIPVVTGENGVPTLFGNAVTPELIRQQLTMGLGLGAVLTYRNPKRKNLTELGEMCLGYGHQWTEHALSLTIVMKDAPVAVRNAFAFDGRFHLSWVENEVNPDIVTFSAAASLKSWRKIMRRKDDKSFKRIQREWFAKVDALLDGVMP